MGKRLSGKKWVLKQKKRRAEKERKKKITFLEKKGEEKKTDSLLIFNINLRFGTWYSILSFRKKRALWKNLSQKKSAEKGCPKKMPLFSKGEKKNQAQRPFFGGRFFGVLLPISYIAKENLGSWQLVSLRPRKLFPWQLVLWQYKKIRFVETCFVAARKTGFRFAAACFVVGKKKHVAW